MGKDDLPIAELVISLVVNEDGDEVDQLHHGLLVLIHLSSLDFD